MAKIENLLITWLLGFSVTAGAADFVGVSQTPATALIPAGIYRPLYRGESSPKEVAVKSFRLDVLPVTNGEFLEFVRTHPEWRRSKVNRALADESYLKHWAADLDVGPGNDAAKQPVTFVSYHAAQAFCAWKQGRLPTTAEWELAASAGFDRKDGASDPQFVATVNQWYSTPSSGVLSVVGASRTNFFGVHDLHGLIWEWTSDFDAASATNEKRGEAGLKNEVFCGGAALNASDRANYPAFMRFGFRESLRANYTVHNLGFRCARDL